MPLKGHESEAGTQLVDVFSVMLQGNASMLERLINGSLMQRLLVCFAWLVVMGEGLCAFRHIGCCSTRQLGSA